MNTANGNLRYQTDSKLDHLGVSELFVLMITRLWVSAYRENPPQDAHWWDGFLNLGIDRQAAAAFDIFMQILFYSSGKPLDIGVRQSTSLSGDEALLLRFVSSMQHHQYSRALEILEGWLSEEEVELIWEPTMLFIAGLTGAKMLVPLCEADLVSAKRLFRCIASNDAVATDSRHQSQQWLH